MPQMYRWLTHLLWVILLQQLYDSAGNALNKGLWKSQVNELYFGADR